jgi:hypothetical protein
MISSKRDDEHHNDPFENRLIQKDNLEQGLFKVYSVYCGRSEIFTASYKVKVEYPENGFTLFKKTYKSIDELEGKLLKNGDKTYAYFTDKYGNRVLRITEEVPCFDSSDYKYDNYVLYISDDGYKLWATIFEPFENGYKLDHEDEDKEFNNFQEIIDYTNDNINKKI